MSAPPARSTGRAAVGAVRASTPRRPITSALHVIPGLGTPHLAMSSQAAALPETVVPSVAYVLKIIMFQVVMYVQHVMGIQKIQLVILKEDLLQVAPAKRGGGGRLVSHVVRDSILLGEL